MGPLAHWKTDVHLVLMVKYNRIKCDEIKSQLNEIE